MNYDIPIHGVNLNECFFVFVEDLNISFWLVGWLVVWGLTAL